MNVNAFFHNVILHGLIDTFNIIPFLFLTYVLMEFLEYKSAELSDKFMKRSGHFGPFIGGALGAIPQCGFSSTASNLYSTGVITKGTIIAVFLSTSDEMIPILVSSSVELSTVLKIVTYKVLVAILVGIVIDVVFKLFFKTKQQLELKEFCEDSECHCEERSILESSLYHTFTISLFILIVTVLLNAVMFFVGKDTIVSIMNNIPVVSHFLASVLGLIPNCAISVLLSTLYVDGIISLGTMISGLLTGSGIGLLVLFKVNNVKKDNLLITLILIFVGVLFGIITDIPFISNLLM